MIFLENYKDEQQPIIQNHNFNNCLSFLQNQILGNKILLMLKLQNNFFHTAKDISYAVQDQVMRLNLILCYYFPSSHSKFDTFLVSNAFLIS